MLRLKRFLFFLALVLVAKLSYAAVVSINETQFSSRSMLLAPSADDGSHTSTYEVTECGANAITSTTASGCPSQLSFTGGTGEEKQEIIDYATAHPCMKNGATVYSCSCPSAYTQQCGSDSYETGGICYQYDESAGKKVAFSKSCGTGLPDCSVYEAAYPTGTDQYRDEAEAKRHEGRSFYMGFVCTIDNNGSPYEGYYYVYPTCDYLQYNAEEKTKTFSSTNSASSYPGGVVEGTCYSGSLKKYPIYCEASYSQTTQPSCSSGAVAFVCTYETQLKYQENCGYADCTSSDMTIMNDRTVPSVQPGTSCSISGPFASVSSNKCYINKDSSDTGSSSDPHLYTTCRCDESIYPYTESSCTDSSQKPVVEKVEYDYYPYGSGSSSGKEPYYDFCVWNAQQSGPNTSGSYIGTFQAIDSSKIRYKRCLPECPSGVTLMDKADAENGSNACSNTGSEMVECAVAISSSNGDIGYDSDYADMKIQNVWFYDLNNYGSDLSNVTFYTAKAYCQCPDYYKTADECEAEGGNPGGKTCSDNGVVKYQLCLPKCDASGSRKYTKNPSEAACGFNQSYSGTNNATDWASGKWFCADTTTGNSNRYSKSTCSGANKTCCVEYDNDSTSTTNCYSNFAFGSLTGSTQYCFPYGESVSAELCFENPSSDPAQNTVAMWQCSCPRGYWEDEACDFYGSDYRGAGAYCQLDKTGKYETCAIPCGTEVEGDIFGYWVDSSEQCKLGNNTQAPFTSCYVQNETDTSQRPLQYRCQCPTSYQDSIYTYCEKQCQSSSEEDCASKCEERTYGIGESCDFDAYKNYGTPLQEKDEKLVKYQDFATKCSYFTEQYGNFITLADNDISCMIGEYPVNAEECYTSDNGNLKFFCHCPETDEKGVYLPWKTIEEYCDILIQNGEKDNLGEPYTQETCQATYSGSGKACSFDVDENKQKVIKYTEFKKGCPTDRPLFENKEDCQINGNATTATLCTDANGQNKYFCSCPANFDNVCYTDASKTVVDTTKVPGGNSCNFESYSPAGIKYDQCLPLCNNTTLTPVVNDVSECPTLNGKPATSTGYCFNKYGDENSYVICSCPGDFKTLEEYCTTYSKANYEADNGPNSGDDKTDADFQNYCKANYIGVGEACTYDYETDGVKKYSSFARRCPTDRPLFYSADECTSEDIPGEKDYVCYEEDNLKIQRVVCKCPSGWYDASDKTACYEDGQDVGKEPSGAQCYFDSKKKVKYGQCVLKCDYLGKNGISNGKGVTYIDSEEEDKEGECKLQLGEGATYGVSKDAPACSKGNVLYYPCYCSQEYSSQCLTEDNLHVSKDVVACTINGETYYTEDGCENNYCDAESATIAIHAITEAGSEAYCQKTYGPGATATLCNVENSDGTLTPSVQCECDASEYTETCEYPYKKPTGKSYCKYADSGNMKTSGIEHYLLGECAIEDAMARCGEYVLEDGAQNSSYTIHVTNTESECTSKYGPGAKTQLCEYEGGNKRAYNCYYNLKDFPVSEKSCPVRHVLSKQYVIENGLYYYKSCDCHKAYKYHKYNCAGMLSGGACSQTVSEDLDVYDETLADHIGDELSFYPYCQCTSDYKYECDGERNVGVGKPCNGKYIACECKPDPLPENWADNYYGCPGGKKPTGVTKANGCGGKYYQCSVTECTWQHTEKCPEPLIGVDPCQDNLGNIGGYKSCKIPSGYQLCEEEGQVGVGEPLIYKGKYYYTSCEIKDTCYHGEIQTCSDEFLVGVNPCVRNNVTYFEYCVCSKGYDQLCTDGQVGVGASCKLNGNEYYTKCETPVSECTSEHKEACDTNQEKYDPCVKDNKTLMYKCRCPQNWEKCTETGSAADAEKCTDANGTVYSQCAVTEACSANQSLTYKECTSSQKGMGGSCLDGDVIKYATCEETSVCRLNGYQYTCLGFDASALGEDYCIDENGNKLYKECKCPTNYVPCPDSSNTKGTACTPIGKDGQLGEKVYSSCTCNEALYKYSCLADEDSNGNIGIIPSGKKSCTPVTYDSASGQAVKGTTLYESCGCEEGYEYTCTSNGQIPSGGYCQTYSGAVKLYKGCTCEDKYNLTCTQEDADNEYGPGVSAPSDVSKQCTTQGIISDSTSGSQTTGTTKYSSCECGKLYNLSCKSTSSEWSYIEVENQTNYCQDKTSAKLYNSCTCPAEFNVDCQADSSNRGIVPPTESSKDTCIEQKYYNGLLETSKKYKSCTCAASYKFQCNNEGGAIEGVSTQYTYTSSKYVNNTSDYCRITTAGADGTSSTTTKYRSCKCIAPDQTTNTAGYMTVEECKNWGTNYAFKEGYTDDICYEVSESGAVTPKYNSTYCACQETSPSDLLGVDSRLIYLVTSSVDPNSTLFKNEVTEKCGTIERVKYANAGCGRYYYYCLGENEGYKYTSSMCEEQTPSGSAIKWTGVGLSKNYTNSYTGSVTLYQSCGCPSSSEYLTSCSQYLDSAQSDIYCTRAENNNKLGCKINVDVELVKLDENTLCIDADGQRKYQRCRCLRLEEDSSFYPSCLTLYNGDPSTGEDDYVCYENGVRKITYNGGGAQGDKTCVCPKATTLNELTNCAGKSPPWHW